MSTFRKYIGLPWKWRLVVLQCLWLLPATALVLELCGCRRMVRLAATADPRTQADPLRSFEDARMCARLVSAVRKRLPGVHCLAESLVLFRLLRQRGLMPQLRIGARKDGGELRAHAWVEFAGRVLNDSEDVGRRFTGFDAGLIPGELKWL